MSAPPPDLSAHVWRAASLGVSSAPGWPSGFAALDAQLPGGGWPTQALTEILQAEAGGSEWRLLGPALRSLLQAPKTLEKRGPPGQAKRPARQTPPTLAQRPLLLINPPRMPHLPGLRAHGVTPQQLVWVQPETVRHRQHCLWATEQAIKADAAAAILAWLPEVRAEQMRRLQAAALNSRAPIFLFRPLHAQAQSSAAPLRLLLESGADWSLRVRVLKRRGPPLADWLTLPEWPAELAPLLSPRVLRPVPMPARVPEPVREPRHELAQA